MNNVRKLSVFLLLSAGVNSAVLADSRCSTDCNTSSLSSSCDTRCSTDCSIDCDTDCDTDCNGSSNCSTVFRARPIVGNLTYRNNLTYFNRYHDARCNFFTWDSTYIFEKNRHSRCAGSGIFGTNNGTLTVGETGADINPIFLGLGANTTDGYSATLTVRPRRRVFSWLSQLTFNLDSCCTGLWTDLSFAVTNVRHRLCLTETDTGTNVIPSGTNGTTPGTVAAALTDLGVLPTRCRRTGVDDAMIRLGYDWNFCGNDHVGFYGLGYIPTGRRRHNGQLFQPTVGTKNGGLGFGFTADYTAWSDESSNSDIVLMTEFKYTFMFRHKEARVFDLNNGPLSRFLLVAPETDTFAAQPILPFLTQCVKVQMRSTIDWWLGMHWQYCNWGAEFDYNLYWRDRERICRANFDFGNFGLYDINNVCGNSTSSSTATPGGAVGAGTSDTVFTPLTSSDVNLRSAAACKALVSTISGSISYNNVWCDCYPWYLGFGGNVEFASRKQRRSNFENWGVFGKAAISF
ncbi:hypothetical protein H0W26_03285 [Candidatus Dependentiae bacterium]|nr:hypothetical protein [Candidatus Dependentiae bacterium]